jgi:hypothetical protein
MEKSLNQVIEELKKAIGISRTHIYRIVQKYEDELRTVGILKVEKKLHRKFYYVDAKRLKEFLLSKKEKE